MTKKEKIFDREVSLVIAAFIGGLVSKHSDIDDGLGLLGGLIYFVIAMILIIFLAKIAFYFWEKY